MSKDIQVVIRKQLRYQLRKAQKALEIEMDFKARQEINTRITKLKAGING